MVPFRFKILVSVGLIFIALVCGSSLVLAEDVDNSKSVDSLMFALSERHFSATKEDLEDIAGGADPLVLRLLEIRRDEQATFAWSRAAKILLEYSDREDVQTALSDDLQSTEHPGLARIISINLESVPSPEVKRHFSILTLERAAKDPQFRPYARSLLKSPDPEIKARATKALGN